MKKIFVIIVAMLATLSMKAVQVEYFDPDTVCPELEGFHLAMGDKTLEDVTSLIDFVESVPNLCQSDCLPRFQLG